MRIACITTSYPDSPGDPSGHFVHRSVRELEHQGHLVTVIAPEPHADGAFGWPGVAARIRERPHRALLAGLWVAGAMRRLSGLAHVDQIVAHWALPSAFPIAFVRDEPLVIVSHGGDVRLLVSLPAPVRNSLARRLARRASEWRFASAALLGELVTVLESGPRAAVERIARVLPPSLDVPDVSREIEVARVRMQHAPYSVVVGRLVETKRVDRALRYMKEDAPHEPIVIVGDGPELPPLRALATALGLRAHFTGKLPRNEALGVLGASRRLLFASRAEGLSSVVREAAALGIPVTYVALINA